MIKNAMKPLLIYGTRHSTLYNLTPFNQPSQIFAIQLSYGDFHNYKMTLQSLPEHISVKKFLNYPQSTLTCLSPYDFSQPQCHLSSENSSFVKIKCKNGYVNIGASEYDKMISLLKPDYVIGLTECSYSMKNIRDQNQKNVKRAMRKTMNYLEKSIYFQKFRGQSTNQNIKKGARIVAIHYGKNMNEIQKNIEEILEYEIDGVAVYGLCENQTREERQLFFETIKLKLNQVQAKRQSSKIKMILAGLGKLNDIQHALNYGFQAFEVNYPFLMAEKSVAVLWNDGKLLEKNPQKLGSLSPLDPSCTCTTCKNYSQTYLSYLIEGNQLNAKILLSIHNLHIYTKWQQKFN